MQSGSRQSGGMENFKERVAQFEYHAAKLVELDTKVQQYTKWHEEIQEALSANNLTSEVYVEARSIPHLSFQPQDNISRQQQQTEYDFPSPLWAPATNKSARALLETRRKDYTKKITYLQEQAGRNAQTMKLLHSKISTEELHNSLVRQYGDA